MINKMDFINDYILKQASYRITRIYPWHNTSKDKTLFLTDGIFRKSAPIPSKASDENIFIIRGIIHEWQKRNMLIGP
jgi:hypothetical protein